MTGSVKNMKQRVSAFSLISYGKFYVIHDNFHNTNLGPLFYNTSPGELHQEVIVLLLFPIT